jgi:tetratricopeptide (TPR) repeat protein
MRNTPGDCRRRSWLLLILLLGVSCGLCGCSRAAKKNRHLTRGQDFFKAHKYDQAEIEFLNALRLERTNAVAMRQLALVYCEQGRIPRAYVALKEAVRLEPLDAEARLRLAGIQLASRELKEAHGHAEAILAHNPANEEALMILADAVTSVEDMEAVRERLEALRPRAENKAGFHIAFGMLQLRQYETNEALASCQRAVSLDPKSSAAHVALGNVFSLLKDGSKADFHFKTGSELAPLRSARRIQYADFKMKSGDLAAARTHLQSITNQAPDFIPPYTRLAEIAFTERQLDEAASLNKKVLNRDPQNYEALLLRGRIDMAKGEPAKALVDFERVVNTYPTAAPGYYHLALAQLLTRNPNQAIQSLRQVVEFDPKHTDAVLLLAELNIRKNEFAAAIAPLKQLVKERPQIAQAHFLLAAAYRGQQDLEAAAAVCEKMTSMFPGNARPYYLWGQILLLEQKKKEARKKFERALEISPEFLQPIDELVDLDIAEQQFSAAEQRVQKYIEKYPKAAALWLMLAKVYSAGNEHAKAEDALIKVIELDPNSQPGYLALARTYIASNKHQLALERLNALLARTPNDPTALMRTAAIHHELKNYTAARDIYEKLLALHPRFAPALNNLAYLYSEELNQLDKAYKLARTARELQPADAQVADTFAWILFKRGEYPWALSLLQESAEQRPTSEVLFHLGMAHYMLGEEQPARLAFRRALNLGHEFRGKAEAEQRLGMLSASPPEAKDLPDLERQLEKTPGDPILLARTALLYERSGTVDKAIKAYNSALQHNPRNLVAMVKLAELYAGPLTNPANAMRIAKDARALAPEDPQVAYILGRLAFQAGDHKWSLSLLQESSQKLGNRPDILYDLAWAWFSLGRIPEAQIALDAALKLGGSFPRAADARRFHEINAVLLKPEIANAASAQIRGATQLDSTYAPALFASGILDEHGGNPSAARQCYAKVLARFPAFYPAHKRLAALLAESDAAAAYEHALKAREGLPDDPEVAQTLGILSFRRREYARASQLLKESASRRPNDPNTLYHLGMAHFYLKERIESRQALEQALSLNSNAVFAPQVKRILAQLN